MAEEETMKKSAIYIIYKWLWYEVDSGVDYYLSASGQGVDTSMDHVWTIFQHFGLTNSLATFQMMMNDIFHDMIVEGVICVYLDDILIFTKTLLEHQTIIWRVLKCLREYNLCLKREECEFEWTQIEYLGVIVSEGTVEMDLVKVSGVSEWLEPWNKRRRPVLCQIHKFLPLVHQGFLSPCVCPVWPH